MKRIFIPNALVCIMLFSCTAYEEAEVRSGEMQEVSGIQTRASGSEDGYEHLPNPYSLEVMQAVYDTYSTSGVQLIPTDLYVRFLPQDSTQLRLLYESGLELFDYPLDVDLDENIPYMDSTALNGGFTWLYTTVKPDYVFPQGIRHEVIEDCYVPEEGETIPQTRVGDIDVEEAAFLSLGYLDEEEGTLETRAQKVTPQGKITMHDDFSNKDIPVKGVKVRGHRFVKYSTGYTDETGHYELGSGFRHRLHYAIVFDNIMGFDIWGNYGPFARANYNMGWHSKEGYNKNIPTSKKAWGWAAINNAAYDYYKMCEQTGISKPPRNLKIWSFKSTSKSSAPMLRRLWHCIGFNSHSAWFSFFINMGYGQLASELNLLLKVFMPDITIGLSHKKYNYIYNSTNHELAHASHFSAVGSAYWAQYVSYIMSYGAYGNGTGKNAELCGIGEMWGYAMGYIQEREKLHSIIPTQYPYVTVDGWIHPQVFWDLYRGNILTKKQIYDCLRPTVRTYDALVSEMYGRYPEKADSIEAKFLKYGITPDVPKPFASFCDQTVTSSMTVTGTTVLARNVTVTNGATLTLIGKEGVTIRGPFVVAGNSGLEIRN